LLASLSGAISSSFFYLRPHPLAELPSGLGGIQHWLSEDMHTEAFYQRTIVSVVVNLAKISSWTDRKLVDGFTGGTGETTLKLARSLSFTISGRAQTYALSVVIGIILMSVWLLRP
jgi:NAD(P)H-quinone oxidoreductase subunit 5